MDFRILADGRAKVLVDRMRGFRLEALESDFERVIWQEAVDLLEVPPASRRTETRKKAALEAAIENVCGMVERFLGEPKYKLTPRDVLDYRCKAACWAIARVLLDEERKATR